jgi:hypothetical protein
VTVEFRIIPVVVRRVKRPRRGRPKLFYIKVWVTEFHYPDGTVEEAARRL